MPEVAWLGASGWRLFGTKGLHRTLEDGSSGGGRIGASDVPLLRTRRSRQQRAGALIRTDRARRLLAWVAAGLIAGCAAEPPRREPPIAYPPAVRDRILRIAEAEWVEWGRIEAGPGRPRPAGGAEGAAEAFPRVLAYWRAVPEAEAAAAIARNRALWSSAPGRAAGVWAEPAWSAAFVSYVMRAAGVDLREFAPSAAHSFYLERDPAGCAGVPGAGAFRAPGPGGARAGAG